MFKSRAFGLSTMLMAVLALVPQARADDFYKGKVFSIVVGFTPAGGYDSQLGFGVVNATAALADAAKLAHHQPAVIGVNAAAARFHGSASAAPVHPRGTEQLVLFAVVALASLMLAAAAATWLTVLRRSNHSARQAVDF